VSSVDCHLAIALSMVRDRVKLDTSVTRHYLVLNFKRISRDILNSVGAAAAALRPRYPLAGKVPPRPGLRGVRAYTILVLTSDSRNQRPLFILVLDVIVVLVQLSNDDGAVSGELGIFLALGKHCLL